MQPQVPPMTPYEERVTQAYQLLNTARLRSMMMYRNVSFCINRCLDTEELYTLLRTTQAPIRYRLQKDLAEKQCVQNCAAKWDELLQMTMMDTNDRAIREEQTNAMLNMVRAMQEQHQQSAK